MDLISLQYSFDQKQDDNVIKCVLCDGSHGNNTLCQANFGFDMEVGYDLF